MKSPSIFYDSLKEALNIQYLTLADICDIIDSLNYFEDYNVTGDVRKPCIFVNDLVKRVFNSKVYSNLEKEAHRLNLKNVYQCYCIIVMSYCDSDFANMADFEVLTLSSTSWYAAYYLGYKGTLQKLFKSYPEYFIDRNSSAKDTIDKIKNLNAIIISSD